MKRLLALLLPTALVTVLAASTPPGSAATTAQVTLAPAQASTRHYTPNSNFDAAGNYTPGTVGFDVADVSSLSQVNSLPADVQGLVWLGLSNGADATFVNTVTPFLGNAKVYGFYLFDEPDPTGQWNTLVTPASLKAQSDWIHARMPAAKTFIVLMNMGSNDSPSYLNTYNPANTDVDLFGLDPYPIRTDGEHYDYINKSVAAAQAAGVPLAQTVPVFQAFGGGSWAGGYVLPTPAQEQEILDTWAALVPSPAFDYVYSWGSQDGDTALAQATDLQPVFLAHNTGTPPASNQAPIANAGPDQTVPAASAGTAEVTLDGSRSTDPDGDPLTYSWAEGSNPLGSTATATVTFPVGVHTVTLTVTDPNGASSNDTVIVTVTGTLHVSALADSSRRTSRTRWQPAVSATVAIESGAPAAAATISFTATVGSVAQSLSCTTGVNGTCVATAASARRGTQVTFTVTGITAAARTYNPRDNAFSSITVTR